MPKVYCGWRACKHNACKKIVYADPNNYECECPEDVELEDIGDVGTVIDDVEYDNLMTCKNFEWGQGK